MPYANFGNSHFQGETLNSQVINEALYFALRLLLKSLQVQFNESNVKEVTLCYLRLSFYIFYRMYT